MEDEAARRVFLPLWSKLCPTAVISNTGTIMPAGESALRKCVMLVYRSTEQPAAKRSQLHPDESSYQVEQRMETMMRVIYSSGILKQNSSTLRSLTLNGSTTVSLQTGDGQDENKLHDLTEFNTPFNPKELIWDDVL